MYEFAYTQKFLRDVKKIKKKHFDLSRLDQVLDDLAYYNSALLKRKYRNHRLKGAGPNTRSCMSTQTGSWCTSATRIE